MPGQGRLGDKAAIQLDTHGCPACPHPGTGPAIQGSPDVRVNRRPALRVDDQGVHAACCGTNLWTAKAGSTTVFINGKSAHRMGDMTRHCGGIGKLVEGSPNVIVGEASAGGGGRGGSDAVSHSGGGGGAASASSSPSSGRGGAPPNAPRSVSPAAAPGASARTSGAGRPADAPPAAPLVDRTHHVELEVEDADGKPLSGATYELVASDGRIHNGTLDRTGRARVDGLPEGTCEVTFTSFGENPRRGA